MSLTWSDYQNPEEKVINRIIKNGRGFYKSQKCKLCIYNFVKDVPLTYQINHNVSAKRSAVVSKRLVYVVARS